MTNSWVITFECHHWLTFKTSGPPRIGEILWCRLCRKEREVISAPPEWRVKCQSCKSASYHGTAELQAEVAAAKHRRLKGNESHVVQIYNGEKLVRVFDGRSATLDDALSEAPHAEDVPPY